MSDNCQVLFLCVSAIVIIFAASISTSRKQKRNITRKGGKNGFETWASIARLTIRKIVASMAT